MRGLFSGGTLCYESQVIWRDVLKEPVLSNAPLRHEQQLADSAASSTPASIWVKKNSRSVVHTR
ncbi:MAG: hypothetical protein U0559_01445 [Anaerolineae bacterium]